MMNAFKLFFLFQLTSLHLGRVRDNLHTCLCFSPVGEKFSTRARNFPGLINGCTIDWFLPWPQAGSEHSFLTVHACTMHRSMYR
jgi:hypothetical protein